MARHHAEYIHVFSSTHVLTHSDSSHFRCSFFHCDVIASVVISVVASLISLRLWAVGDEECNKVFDRAAMVCCILLTLVDMFTSWVW